MPLLEPELSAAGLSGKAKTVAEPRGRNTAPAILLGALEIVSRDEDAVMAVFPLGPLRRGRRGLL